MLSHTGVLSYTILLHSAFTVSSLTQRFFYPQILLHRDILALHNDVFHRQAFFHAHTGALTGMFFKTHTLFHRDSCTQKCCCTEMLSHRDGFTHKNTFPHTHFYTEMILHWAALHADTITSRGAFTKQWIYTKSFGCFYTGMLLYDFRRRARIFAPQEFSKQM